MNTLASLTGELALAREAVAGRLRGVDPDDIPAQRKAYDAFAENDPLPEGAGQSTIDLGGVSSLGVLPEGASGERVILWMHGGGYVVGSSVSHRGLGSQVAAAAGCAVVLPDYRLAPEHVYPAAIEDCVAVYHAVLAEGVAPEQIVLAGDSAGGALAVSTALRLKKEGAATPAGLMLLSPWVDLSCEGWSYDAKSRRDPFLTASSLQARAKQYLGAASHDDPGIDLLNADLRGLPPTIIQTGEAEVVLSDSTTLAERIGAAGAPVTLEIWPEMFHVFQARYPMLTQARQAITRLGAWAGAHLRS
ncbi:MAG: alpha/beta hydrolase fold domain-containing protein [Alphaproteobacteria bacterium]|nr:alpha/beta hydrolase fold domain-containing protein [Alphaproteobacteria bacterium]